MPTKYLPLGRGMVMDAVQVVFRLLIKRVEPLMSKRDMTISRLLPPKCCALRNGSAKKLTAPAPVVKENMSMSVPISIIPSA